MTPAFLAALSKTLAVEGGYSNHKKDPGGRTIYGISERAHQEAWVNGPPTLDQAREIYYREYWQPLNLDAITSQAIREEVFDSAVLHGPRSAVLFLQRAYNLLRHSGDRLTEDGQLGPKTIASVNAFCVRPECADALYSAANWYQGQALINTGNTAMLRGWFAHRVKSA